MNDREWTLQLPFDKPLSLNDRMGWQKKHRLMKEWRDATHLLARSQRIPRLDRWTAELHWSPKVVRERDLDNVAPTLKACADGIRDATGCLDTAEHYALSGPIIHPATGQPGRLWLVVRELLDEHQEAS